jgi:hypothetical protein
MPRPDHLCRRVTRNRVTRNRSQAPSRTMDLASRFFVIFGDLCHPFLSRDAFLPAVIEGKKCDTFIQIFSSPQQDMYRGAVDKGLGNPTEGSFCDIVGPLSPYDQKRRMDFFDHLQ